MGVPSLVSLYLSLPLFSRLLALAAGRVRFGMERGAWQLCSRTRKLNQNIIAADNFSLIY